MPTLYRTRRMSKVTLRFLESRLLLNRFVGSDFAVADVDDAVSVLGNVIFVGDQNDGVSLTVQIGEQGHDFLAGARVEVSSRLVGQDDRRRVHQSARNGNALALPT